MGVLKRGSQPHILIRVLKGGVPNTLIPMGVVKGAPNPISLMGSLRKGGPYGGFPTPYP